jgi:ankyrin repeat protein
MAGIDRGGRTPLHYAALANDADAVSWLLTEGADPNAADRMGFTALHFAAQEGAIAAAGILLAAGAQVDSADSYVTPRCPRPYSTAADAVSSSGCYAATEPTHGTRTTQGRPRSAPPA